MKDKSTWAVVADDAVQAPAKPTPAATANCGREPKLRTTKLSLPESGAGPAVAEPPPQPSPAGTGKDQADWKTEYSRVFSDLKQLLVVSVALFALMLVVGFFL